MRQSLLGAVGDVGGGIRNSTPRESVFVPTTHRLSHDFEISKFPVSADSCQRKPYDVTAHPARLKKFFVTPIEYRNVTSGKWRFHLRKKYAKFTSVLLLFVRWTHIFRIFRKRLFSSPPSRRWETTKNQPTINQVQSKWVNQNQPTIEPWQLPISTLMKKKWKTFRSIWFST